MKVKAFYLRLTKADLQADQDAINTFLAGVDVLKSEAELITGQSPNYWSILFFYKERTENKTEKQFHRLETNSEAELTLEEQAIYMALKRWRDDVATREHKPAYFIAHNAHLMDMAKLRPSEPEDLIKIKGFRQRKIAKFGADIIAVLNSI